MNIGEGLSGVPHETWRGCQSILFPSHSLDLTRASGRSVFLSGFTITHTHIRTKTKKQHCRKQLYLLDRRV